MSFGGFYGATTEEKTMRALGSALELGVDFWDTANVYAEGLSETLIGKFLSQDRSRRGKITLATKFGIRWLPDRKREFDNSAAHIRECLEGSLTRLGVEHVDLVTCIASTSGSRSRTRSASSPASWRRG